MVLCKFYNFLEQQKRMTPTIHFPLKGIQLCFNLKAFQVFSKLFGNLYPIRDIS